MELQSKTREVFKLDRFQSQVDFFFEKCWLKNRFHFGENFGWDSKRNMKQTKEAVRLFVFASTLFLLELIFKSKEFFGSSFVYFIKPPFNFDSSNIFYEMFIKILDLSCAYAEGIVLPLNPLVPHIEADFDPDCVHFSKLGNKQFYFNFSKLMDLVQDEFLREVQDFVGLAEHFNKRLFEIETKGSLHTRHNNVFSKKPRMPKNEHKKFEQKYFKDCKSSGKKLAVINSFRPKLSKDRIDAEVHKKKFVVLSDSLGRDFFDGSKKAKNARAKKQGYFRYNSCYAISPGATCFHYCESFGSKHFLKYASLPCFVLCLSFPCELPPGYMHSNAFGIEAYTHSI